MYCVFSCILVHRESPQSEIHCHRPVNSTGAVEVNYCPEETLTVIMEGVFFMCSCPNIQGPLLSMCFFPNNSQLISQPQVSLLQR